MIIVADENIVRAGEAFAQFGEVRLLSGRAILREVLADADALIVRSITQVNRALLEGTPVRFVGTATIGTDHIDFDYLREHEIAFADAAGAGARSVAEYLVAALLALRARGRLKIIGEKLGVVGVGAIGSLIARFARTLGMEVLEYDPPRSLAEPGFRSVPFAMLFDCDVIVLAVPLTHEGEHPTHHLADADFLSRMKAGSLLINTSRGEVVDSSALFHALETGRVKEAILDVWEGEPEVPAALLERCFIATPHIAGYSQDGKLKGTEMMADGLANYLNLQNRWSVREALPSEAGRIALNGLAPLDEVHRAVRTAYDINRDDADLRAIFPLAPEERRKKFDLLRKDYPIRREFPAWHFSAESRETERILRELGFTATAENV